MSPRPRSSSPLTSPSLHSASTFSITAAPLPPLSTLPPVKTLVLPFHDGSPPPSVGNDHRRGLILGRRSSFTSFSAGSWIPSPQADAGVWPLNFALRAKFHVRQICCLGDLWVPFLTGPPPAWPGPCRYCWSPFEGPGLFPSIQPAVCPYPSAAPAGSRSTRRHGIIS